MYVATCIVGVDVLGVRRISINFETCAKHDPLHNWQLVQRKVPIQVNFAQAISS